MPIRPLPNHPSLEHLRKHAKRLLTNARAGASEAIDQFREFHPRASEKAAQYSLADAQFVIARSHGFTNWAALKRHLAAIEPFVWELPALPERPRPVDVLLRLACLTYAGWHPGHPARAARLLADDPTLARADIYTAAALGDVAGVKAFLTATPGMVNRKGGTLGWEPLLYACYSRMTMPNEHHSTLAVAQLLLSSGADANAGFLLSGSYAFTALTGAFGRGEDWDNQPPHPDSMPLARLLLDAGADPNDAQSLYNRHFQPDDEHLRLLLAYGLGKASSGPWLARLNDRRVTPAQLLIEELGAAAKHNFAARVALLVEHGVDVNAMTLRSGRTPYEEALREGHAQLASYLHRHGARKIELDPLEAFAVSCVNGRRTDAHNRLRDDPTLMERLGPFRRVELLHRAVDAKNKDGVRLVLELGVDINAMVPCTALDRAVLHNAAGWGGLDMVQFLIALGADPFLRDQSFQSTPIGWAYHNHQSDVVAYLLQFASIFDALRCDGVNRVEALLNDDRTRANAKDDEGTPLIFYLHPQLQHLARLVGLLASAGADFSATNQNGRTLAELAALQGWDELSELLKVHGAPREIR